MIAVNAAVFIRTVNRLTINEMNDVWIIVISSCEKIPAGVQLQPLPAQNYIQAILVGVIGIFQVVAYHFEYLLSDLMLPPSGYVDKQKPCIEIF